MDIILSVYFYGNVDMCNVSQPENDFLYRQFSNALADSFLTFVVAHECAHYYLGHLGDTAVKGIVTVGKKDGYSGHFGRIVCCHVDNKHY